MQSSDFWTNPGLMEQYFNDTRSIDELCLGDTL
jgi:hypothetical protein